MTAFPRSFGTLAGRAPPATMASPAIWTRDAITTDPSGRVVSTAADGRESGLDVPSGPSYHFGRDPWGRPVTTEEGGQVREQVWGNPGGVWPLAGVDETGAATLVVAVEGLLVGVVTDGAFAPAASDPAGNAVFVGTEWLGSPDAWGLDAVEPTTTSFRHVFAGLEVLPGTGGYHLAQHRLYDAGTGRFARMDPLGVAGGPSRFTYAENDPTSRWDPTGLSAADCGSSAQLPHPENLRATMTTESWPQNAYTAESLLAAATGDVDRRRSAVWASVAGRSAGGTRGTQPVGGPSGPESPGGPVASGWDGIRRWAPSKGAATPEGNEGELDTEDSPHLTSETEDGKRRVDGISPGEDITGLEDADGELLEEADDARVDDPGRSGDGGSIGGASEGDPAAGPSGLEVAFGALVGEAGERLSSALGGMLQVGQAAVMDPGSLTLPGQMLRQGAGAAPGLVVEAVQRAVESTPAVTFFGPMAEAPSRAAALLLAEGSTTEGLFSGNPGEAAASAELVMDVAQPTLEAGLNLLGVYGMRAVAPKPGVAPVPGASGGVVEGASRLVGANRAVIDPRKLTEYALNPAHPVGGNKARVFESALGYNRGNADGLLKQLQAGVMENTPVAGKVDAFGARYTVDIPVVGPGGSATVRTGWIYAPGSSTPELTTLFVK